MFYASPATVADAYRRRQRVPPGCARRTINRESCKLSQRSWGGFHPGCV